MVAAVRCSRRVARSTATTTARPTCGPPTRAARSHANVGIHCCSVFAVGADLSGQLSRCALCTRSRTTTCASSGRRSPCAVTRLQTLSRSISCTNSRLSLRQSRQRRAQLPWRPPASSRARQRARVGASLASSRPKTTFSTRCESVVNIDAVSRSHKARSIDGTPLKKPRASLGEPHAGSAFLTPNRPVSGSTLRSSALGSSP